MNDRAGQWGRHRGGMSATIACGIVLLVACGALAEDPCGKLPDLWFPSPGVVLTGGVTSVQVTSGDVCEGGTVTIVVTIDNLSCGDSGAFDVTAYWDNAAHAIQTKHVSKLAGCEFVKLTFTWDTHGVPPGEHTILVIADSGTVVKELNEGNNQYTFDVLIRPNAPLLEATKTDVDIDEGQPNPGDTIRYEIEIRNDGCAPLPNGPEHEFSDTLPAGVTPTGFAQASRGSIVVSGGVVFWDGDIPAGGSVKLVFKVTIDGEIESGTEICNQGFARYDSDGNGTYDQSEPTDDPATPADDDPTCFVVERSNSLLPLSGTIDAPSLSEWGMIVLSVLMAAALGWRLYRRQAVSS